MKRTCNGEKKTLTFKSENKSLYKLSQQMLCFFLSDPPRKASSRLSSYTYLFRDLTSDSSQFFFTVLGRVPGRGGMWKEAQLEQRSNIFLTKISVVPQKSLKKRF